MTWQRFASLLFGAYILADKIELNLAASDNQRLPNEMVLKGENEPWHDSVLTWTCPASLEPLIQAQYAQTRRY